MQFIGNAECVHSVWVTVSPSHGGERPEKLTLNGPFLTHKPDQRKEQDPTTYKPHYTRIWKKPCSPGIFVDRAPHAITRSRTTKNLDCNKSIKLVFKIHHVHIYLNLDKRFY